MADALFSATQQRVLGRLFGQPTRSFYATELIAAAGGGSGAVQRELARLEACGLIVTTRIGNQKHYQANGRSPIFDELASLVRKTFGVADVLRAALQPLAESVEVAFVFGSVAKGSDVATSDIDVMVIGTASFADVVGAAHGVQSQLGREVNPVVMTAKAFRTKLAQGERFVSRVVSEPKIMLMGDFDELGKPAQDWAA